MNKQIDWNSIATPLDVRNVYSPRHFIRKWLTYQSSPQGIIFSCELANGDLFDYYVDVLQADVIRFRMNAFGLKIPLQTFFCRQLFLHINLFY